MTVPSILQRLSDNRIAFHVCVTVCSLLLMFSRRPDAFLNPQFWAEDGAVWYADAYNHGIFYSLMTPEAGYYQTVSRLVAIFAQLFPLYFAPAVFNFVAIAVKALIANFLVSSRLSEIVRSFAVRLLIGFVYLALPHSGETHANLTNVQWHLALLAFLVIVVPGKHTAAKAFDIVVVAISALSGPFCLLLLPIAAVRFAVTRDRASVPVLLILAAGSLIQLGALLTSERPSRQPLGATVSLASKIVGGHWFLSAIAGERWHGWLIRHSIWNDATAIVVNIAGVALTVYAAIRARIELRLLIIFSAMIVAGALLSPAASGDVPQWTAMWLSGIGSRYWLIPIFTFFLVLIFIALRGSVAPVRYLAMALLLLSLAGIATDWRYARFKDLSFHMHAARFESAAPGEEVVIPINPDWGMRLRKK